MKDVVFDRNALLTRLGGDEGLLGEIMNTYLVELPVMIGNLKKALEEGNIELVEREAHTLKGASANVGALALSEAALRIETAGKNKELQGADELVAALEVESERLKGFL